MFHLSQDQSLVVTSIRVADEPFASMLDKSYVGTKQPYPSTVTDASVVKVDSRDFQKMGFHLLSSSSGFLDPLPPSSSSSGVGIPGIDVKARAREIKCVWGRLRGRTRKWRGVAVSLFSTNGRSDDMVVNA
mgnify:FL=1